MSSANLTARLADTSKFSADASASVVAAGAFQQKCFEVRNSNINWQSYLQGQMISQEDFQFIIKFNNAITPEARTALLKDFPFQCAKTMVSIMSHISKDQTVQYILTLIDDLLQEDPSRVELFRDYAGRRKENAWTPFLNMLSRPDPFIMNQTARIITKLACWQPQVATSTGQGHAPSQSLQYTRHLMEGSDLLFFLNWIKDQLKQYANEYLQNIVRCLQMMLRVDEYKKAFVNQIDGLPLLISLLQNKIGFQLQYQLTFCIWTLSFNPALAEKISRYPVIPLLAEVLNESVKEKLSRIILALFRNLLEKVDSETQVAENAMQMVQRRVLKQLELLEARKPDDDDLAEDVKWLSERLQTSVQDLSSFDEYATEVRSAKLEWSPVHRSDRFWRENAHRLNERSHELLKMLIKLLEKQGDAQTVAIAAHDLGEYVRYHPRGKMLVEQLGGKQLLMQHLQTHEDQGVKYEALLAIQKLMVHNWEYLGKTIDGPSDGKGKGAAAPNSANPPVPPRTAAVKG